MYFMIDTGSLVYFATYLKKRSEKSVSHPDLEIMKITWIKLEEQSMLNDSLVKIEKRIFLFSYKMLLFIYTTGKLLKKVLSNLHFSVLSFL